MFGWLKRENPHARAVARLYEHIVAQSRRPEFYRDLSVADSLDGRFDMLSLHVMLVMKRLKDESQDAGAFSQTLFDHMFADMDLSLREIGVSDLSVGKRVKQMGEAFLGRVAAYDAALTGGEGALEEALVRNVYRDAAPAHEAVTRLADYVRATDEALTGQALSDLMNGDCTFPEMAPGEGT